jgi:Tfp pilus assembly protein PilF
MSMKRTIRWIGAGLLLSTGFCLAQAAGDTQEQIAHHNRKIQQYLQEKRPDLAIPELQALVALDPNNADAHGNLGVLFFFKGDCAQATPQLRAATSQRTALWRQQVLLGICERRTGDDASARADFESAFPHLEDEKVRLEAGMELVNLYMSSGDLDKAVPVIEVLRAHNPTNISVLYTSYRIHTQLAGEAMLSLSMVDPDSAEMHQVMAHETLRYGDPAGAIAQYRAAIKINPKLAWIHFELAEVLSDSTDPASKQEAEREYKIALQMNPGDEKAECRLGEIEAAGGNLAQAQADYTEAVKLAPADVEAKLGLAKTLIALNQRDQARPLLEQALQQEPDSDTAHYLLSRLFWQEGRKEDANREVELYKKYKAMKDKLRAVYKEMRVTPSQSVSETLDEHGAPKE